MKKCSILLFISILLSACIPSSTQTYRRYQTTTLELFDTVSTIIGYATSQAEFDNMAATITQELTNYHKLYDIYNEYPSINNLATINKMAGIKPVTVDEEIINLLQFSKQIYQETNGKTNIALGSVLNLWHNAREAALKDPGKATLPDTLQLARAAEHTNIQDIMIDSAQNKVYLKNPNMRLDVGAVAKGYAVEQIAQHLAQKGFCHILLNVGGNIRAVGPKPDGNPWQVGVENPYGDNKLITTVELVDGSMVMSGNYQRYFMLDDMRYHHIIDTDTLYPAQEYAAVAVLCNNSAYADAYSTALFTMPYEMRKQWQVEHPEIQVIWMMPNQEIEYSNNWVGLL